MQTHFDRTKCLQDLEGDDWGEPPLNSYLVRACHRLRRKPLNEFSVEDLRIMIGQQFSLDFLVPLAIERLKQNSLAEGDFYPGDLLQVVIQIGGPFWERRTDCFERVCDIVRRVESSLESLEESERDNAREVLGHASGSFEWLQRYGF